MKMQAIDRRSLHEELAERLRDLIGTGSLAPGQRIAESRLSEEFGVSKTPLREALKVLASEGIVQLRPNRGAVVRAITSQELDELFPVIGALEAMAGKLACKNITNGELADIRTLHGLLENSWREKQLQRYFQINRSIHEGIFDAARNDVLRATYDWVSRRLPSLRYTANMSEQNWLRAMEEHRAMMEALAARDGENLSRILQQHLSTKRRTVHDWLQLASQEPQSPPDAE